MNNKEILEKAISKAIDGGWDDGRNYLAFIQAATYNPSRMMFESGGDQEIHLYEIIFNKDFAKALWGDDQLGIDYKDLNGSDAYYEGSTECLGREMPAWMHHLQQMVITEDPIKYLGGNL